jgi:homoserine kinase type II
MAGRNVFAEAAGVKSNLASVAASARRGFRCRFPRRDVVKVFLLHHVRPHNYDDGKDIKLCGVFSSHERAFASQASRSNLPGFKNYPDGFSIDEHELDREHWTEGFGIEWPPEDETEVVE